MDVIAHRGASAYAPEHTPRAYDLALEQGADVLELDVRVTADGTPVVLHDPTLARTAGDPRPVTAVRDAELAGLGVPTVEAVLARYGTSTRYLVEVKESGPAAESALLATIERHGLRGQVTVQSFRRSILRRVRALDPGLALAPLYRPFATSAGIRAGLARTAPWAASVSPCARSVDAALVLAAHARGLAVQAYTVNGEAEMERLAALGVDGIITDVPDRLGAVRAAARGAALAA